LKKKVAILFLLMLFVSQIGYYFIYLFQQHEIKEAVKEQLLKTIPDELLVAINADANKDIIEWEEEGREFSMNGDMYDVARTKTVNGATILYCMSDTKEDQLLDDLAKSVRSANDNTANGKDTRHTVKFQLVDFVAPITEKITIISNRPALQKYAGYDVAILSSIKEVDIPPPKINHYA
jgi:hypothetical protein